MLQLRIYPTSINEQYISQAVEALRDGGIIIYPTDTLYAIACDALRQNAIERVCALKNLNPQKNTLAIVCDSISQASQYARIDNKAFNIIRANTPGQFTFILPTASTLPKAFKGRKTVGIRIPDNPIARRLAEALGNPLLTTSLPAEGFDDEQLTYPEEIAARFERSAIDIFIDGGQGLTIPSTVVDLTDSSNPEIIRQGAATLEI